MRKTPVIIVTVCLLIIIASLSLMALSFPYTGLPLFALLGMFGLTLTSGRIDALKGYQYTAWIITAVFAGMLFPQWFQHWGSVNLRDKTLILVIIQVVMFGMGTHMRLKDFNNFASTGKGVLAGLLCHFSIMPLMGWLLTRIFHFDPEIAAGIILIGSCSSGLASNVMVYLARANLALSVIVTAMATLVAPVCTPLLMKLLAGAYIQIRFFDMMMEIVKIVIVPIGAALLHDYLLHVRTEKRYKIYTLTLVCVLLLIVWIMWLKNYVSAQLLPAFPEWYQSIELLAYMAGAVMVGTIYNILYKSLPALTRLMPLLSMAGIIYFTTVTTAAGRDNLVKVGLLLFIASVIHNAAGYFFGYWFSRFLGMNKQNSRTIAFEVGLQNGGMASGLAGAMGKLGTVGLPAAVFSPWMNISGSLLANYWRKRPVEEEDAEKSVVPDSETKPLLNRHNQHDIPV